MSLKEEVLQKSPVLTIELVPDHLQTRGYKTTTKKSIDLPKTIRREINEEKHVHSTYIVYI